MAERLTLKQLSARIDECERAMSERLDARIAELERTVAGLQDQQCVRERPSRAQAAPIEGDWPVVTVRGVRCHKVTQWEHGRRVTTYKPLAH